MNNERSPSPSPLSLSRELQPIIPPRTMPQSHQAFHPVPTVKSLGILFIINVGPSIFTLLQPEMPMVGVNTGWCNQIL